jgi:hypothetical protein
MMSTDPVMNADAGLLRHTTAGAISSSVAVRLIGAHVAVSAQLTSAHVRRLARDARVQPRVVHIRSTAVSTVSVLGLGLGVKGKAVGYGGGCAMRAVTERMSAV